MKVFVIFENVIEEIYYGEIDEYTGHAVKTFRAACSDKSAVQTWFAEEFSRVQSSTRETLELVIMHNCMGAYIKAPQQSIRDYDVEEDVLYTGTSEERS